MGIWRRKKNGIVSFIYIYWSVLNSCKLGKYNIELWELWSKAYLKEQFKKIHNLAQGVSSKNDDGDLKLTYWFDCRSSL